MSVLVYAENWEGNFRKSTFEAVSYANETANLLGTDVVALSFGDVSHDELAKLGNYGANKVITTTGIEKGDGKAATDFFASIFANSKIIIFSNTYTSKMIAPRLSARFKAGIISNVIGLPFSTSPIKVLRKTFSSKALEKTVINTEKAIIMLAPNSYGIKKCEDQKCEIQNIEFNKNSSVTINGQEVSGGKISLSEAEIIISAGRGLKGPENWQMIEELANTLGAATACSKPVSDIGWRPHSEHVGQTGKTVAPNLYIAVGISGAIQHLAGVNSSKVIVAINTDPEAPFFKAANYGIVGDAFEVVPKLIEEIKKTR